MGEGAQCSIEGCEATKVVGRGWCRRHYLRWWRHGDPLATLRVSRSERMWSKVNKCGPRGCWIWTGTRRGEYGVFRLAPKSDGRGYLMAHRAVYEEVVGPIPEGLTLDHKCRVTMCVNPGHLEPVTLVENVMRGNGVGPVNARKTHCLKGHPFSGENLYVTPRGWRQCRTCLRAANARHRKKVTDADDS